MNTQIVPLKLSDIRAVYRLEQAIFPKDAYPYLDLAFLFLLPGMINRKAVDLDQSEKLAGILAMSDVWLPWGIAWVITLGVDQSYQNRGLGGQLLSQGEAETRAKRVRLTVRRSNAPAIHLYHKMNYQIIKQVTRYYNDGEDGLIMEKTLI